MNAEHTVENGLPPLTIETCCIGCGHPNPTGFHIAGCAEAQRKMREPVQFARVDDNADHAARMAAIPDEAMRVAEDVWTEDEPTLAEYELTAAILAAARVIPPAVTEPSDDR